MNEKFYSDNKKIKSILFMFNHLSIIFIKL